VTTRHASAVTTCVSCHAATGDPHSIQLADTFTRKKLVENCSDCHSNTERMARYGPNTDAVHSYDLSFHGKAFLRFDNQKTAICTDCHGYHDVRSPADPKAATNVANIAKTCGQPDCHPGATMNFGMSGASHLHLKIKETPLLSGVEWFFKTLTFAVIGFLLLGVGLDIRRALFGANPPPSGRLVGGLVAFGFLAMVAAIVMAVLHVPGGMPATMVAVGLIGVAVVINAFRPKKKVHDPTERKFMRLNLSLRIQHLALAISFTLLVVTGIPIRYPENDVLRDVYMALGGMPVMRLLHRVAAVVMIVAWVYHTFELLYKWYRAGFKMSSWTMWPRLKDFGDFFTTIKYHLGLAKSEPAYDRFQFREKFDYFAVYWGMPIMVLSGLILWFPVYFANYLPALGIPVAYIAHADEAVLAFLTIVTWHFYNTHFNPNHFPMNPVFYKGTISESEMKREHPLELVASIRSNLCASSLPKNRDPRSPRLSRSQSRLRKRNPLRLSPSPTTRLEPTPGACSLLGRGNPSPGHELPAPEAGRASRSSVGCRLQPGLPASRTWTPGRGRTGAAAVHRGPGRPHRHPPSAPTAPTPVALQTRVGRRTPRKQTRLVRKQTRLEA